MELRGVLAIPVAPFDEGLDPDLGGVGVQAEFCIARGAVALVGPLIASEHHILTDAERMGFIQAMVEAAAGRVPVLAGVSGVSAQHAAHLARVAEARGASGLVASPPVVATFDTPRTVAYFGAIGAASGLPLMIQNAPPPTGGALSEAGLAEVLASVPQVFSVKQELPPDPQTITRVRDATAGRGIAVYGGKGRLYLPGELSRGADGTMPASPLTGELAAPLRRLVAWGRGARACDPSRGPAHDRAAPALRAPRRPRPCCGAGASCVTRSAARARPRWIARTRPRWSAPWTRSRRSGPMADPGGRRRRLEDVAEAAGVSRATVWRALNQPGGVSADTAARVARAVRATGYYPDMVARAMRTDRSALIAMVVPAVEQAFFQAIQRAGAAASRAGFETVLGVTDYDADAERAITGNMLGRRVAAMILAGNDQPPRPAR